MGRNVEKDQLSERNQARFLKNLTKIREARGMTQREASEALGRSATYFQLLEAGEFFPPIPTLFVMKKVFRLKSIAPFFAGMT